MRRNSERERLKEQKKQFYKWYWSTRSRNQEVLEITASIIISVLTSLAVSIFMKP